MQADQPGVQVIPNNNYFASRDGLTPTYVIVHGTAGGTSAVAIANYFASTQGGDDPVSSNYVIGQDGEIVQCVAESDGAWAQGAFTNGHADWWDTSINPNNVAISIEHCKPSTDNSDALTPAQQAASFKLIHDICQRWNIPMRDADGSGGITGHFSIDPVNRSECPGPYPWGALWNYLQGDEHMIPNGWKDNGTILTASNNIDVRQGFRQHIIDASNWDAGNVPLETEQNVPQVLLHNTSVGSGDIQLFRDSLLWWTAKNGVVQEPQLGAEIKACYDKIATLETQLKDAQEATQKQPVVTPPATTPGTISPAKISDAITTLKTLNTALGSMAPLFAALESDLETPTK